MRVLMYIWSRVMRMISIPPQCCRGLQNRQEGCGWSVRLCRRAPDCCWISWGWRWLLRGWWWAETRFRKTTCCHFFRQSAPLGRLKAHPLNSGCQGVPDWSDLIDVIVPWQILKKGCQAFPDCLEVKHIHILFIRFSVDLISRNEGARYFKSCEIDLLPKNFLFQQLQRKLCERWWCSYFFLLLNFICGNRSFAENSPEVFLASNIYWGKPSFFEENMAEC